MSDIPSNVVQTGITAILAQKDAELAALQSTLTAREVEVAGLRAEVEEARRVGGMVGWDGSTAEGIQRIIETRDQFFLQACENGGSAQEQRARAEAAEARALAAEAKLDWLSQHNLEIREDNGLLALWYTTDDAFSLREQIDSILDSTLTPTTGGKDE